MDREHRKHVETVRLIITEIIMVITIVVMAVVLTFLAMGYNLNKDGELGQSGLVQLRSFPSGASIAVDGETVLLKTNTSRMLTAGEHTIKLSKEGYDTWEKTILSESGRLLKLEYMRLFYQDRVAEEVSQLSGELDFFVPAPERDYAILVQKNSNKWTYFDLRGDGTSSSELDLTTLLKDLTVEKIVWNKNSDKLLVQAVRKNEKEWLLINVRDLKKSINLTKEFAMNFSEMQFVNDGGDKIYALEQGNLRIISLGDKTVSQVMADNIKKFSFVGDAILYLTNSQELKLISGGNEVVIETFSGDELVNVALSEYLGQKYLSLTTNEKMTVYRGDLPNSERSLAEMEKLIDTEINFVPSGLAVYGEGELIAARDEKKVAVYDAETNKVYQYELETTEPFLIDGYMVGEIVDEKLIVRDFDGTNKREITKANSAAVITKNNKWLYYLILDQKQINLTREKIIE